MRVKREYNEVFEIDGEGEVEWVGTRPVRKRVSGGFVR